MCYDLQTVMLMVALAVTSGADWEGLARQTVASRLGVETGQQNGTTSTEPNSQTANPPRKQVESGNQQNQRNQQNMQNKKR